MKLLNCGRVIDASVVTEKIQEITAKYESIANIPEEELNTVLEYEKMAGEFC